METEAKANETIAGLAEADTKAGRALTGHSPREPQPLPMSGGTIEPATIQGYEFETYRSIGLNDLLVHVILSLEDMRVAATFENITVAAHRMFPGKFSLVGYPQFPDATRVQLVILHLGPKYVGWLEGKKKLGYRLNARGREAAKALVVRLGAPPTADTPTSDFAQDNLVNRTAVETRLDRLTGSPSFRRYAEGNCQSIDDVTLAWDALGLFITADNLTKASTYRQLLEAAHQQKNQAVERFLLWVAKERPYLIGKSGRVRQPPPKRRPMRRRD